MSLFDSKPYAATQGGTLMSEKERGIFERYYLEQMRPRWERMKQVKELERTYDIEKVGIWENCRLLYHNSTLSFVYGNYLACVTAIGAAIEAYLFTKIPRSYWRDEFDPKQYKHLSLGWIISIVKKKGIISENMATELHSFAETIRDNVIHPRVPLGFDILGFKLTSLTSFESPTGEAIYPIPIDEAALKGITLFIRTVREVVKP